MFYYGLGTVWQQLLGTPSPSCVLLCLLHSSALQAASPLPLSRTASRPVGQTAWRRTRPHPFLLTQFFLYFSFFFSFFFLSGRLPRQHLLSASVPCSFTEPTREPWGHSLVGMTPTSTSLRKFNVPNFMGTTTVSSAMNTEKLLNGSLFTLFFFLSSFLWSACFFSCHGKVSVLLRNVCNKVGFSKKSVIWFFLITLPPKWQTVLLFDQIDTVLLKVSCPVMPWFDFNTIDTWFSLRISCLKRMLTLIISYIHISSFNL